MTDGIISSLANVMPSVGDLHNPEYCRIASPFSSVTSVAVLSVHPLSRATISHNLAVTAWVLLSPTTYLTS